MDDRLRICLWMVGGGFFGAVLGAAFGALTGALYARNGGAAGTRWARHLVEQFLKSAERQPSPIRRAALIGGADGFIFLGILGFIVGVLLGIAGRSADEWRVPLIVGSVLLVGGAVFFGVLAYALTYANDNFFRNQDER